MWNDPHYSYAIAPLTDLSILDRIELLVPGALVYGRVQGRKRRLEKMSGNDRRQVSRYEVLAPVNAAFANVTSLLGTLNATQITDVLLK